MGGTALGNEGAKTMVQNYKMLRMASCRTSGIVYLQLKPTRR